MVKRYIEIPEAEVATCMHEHFAGDYVRYEDYAALELKVLAAINNLEEAREWSDPESVDAGLLLAVGALRGRE